MGAAYRKRKKEEGKGGWGGDTMRCDTEVLLDIERSVLTPPYVLIRDDVMFIEEIG